MALQIGDINASFGMSKAIYDELNNILSPPLDGTPSEEMTKIRDAWRQLAFAVAKGVISHIKSNMEISGVEVSINDVSTNVNVTTSCPSGTGTGTGTGSGSATGQQSNSGTNLVN